MLWQELRHCMKKSRLFPPVWDAATFPPKQRILGVFGGLSLMSKGPFVLIEEIRIKTGHKLQNEKVPDTVQCPKNYVCRTFSEEKLCQATDIGLESFLVCLEKNPAECLFAICYGDMYFCQCPLRIDRARKVTKATAVR
jgi:hypothetical protein